MSNTNQLEALFISSMTSDPFSMRLLNPFTLDSIWSLRGTELQGGTPGAVEPLGRNVKHLLVAISDKPILYCTSLNSKSGHFASRSVLPGIAKFLASHPSGAFIFTAIENKIYTWMVSTGDLLSIADDAFQEISAMKISPCGSYLVVGLADGNVKAYTVHSLITQRQHQIEPIFALVSFPAHSLAVSDLHVTGSRQPRILSVSLDHTIVLSSLCVRQPLLKISADYPITSCCMDAAESRIIIGIKSGRICVIDLFLHCPKGNDETNVINIAGASDQQNSAPLEGSNSGLQIFEHHNEEIRKLCVNCDGTRLASADMAGCYCIWDLSNGQCVKTASMKGPISTLRFTEFWPELNADAKAATAHGSAARRQRQSTAMAQFKPTISTSFVEDSSDALSKLVQFGKQEEVAAFLCENFEDLLSELSEEKTTILNEKQPSEKRSRKGIQLGDVSLNDDALISSAAATTNNNNIDEDDDIELIEYTNPTGANAKGDGPRPKNPHSDEADAPAKKERIRALEREVKQLIRLNQHLYEFAAKAITNTDL